MNKYDTILIKQRAVYYERAKMEELKNNISALKGKEENIQHNCRHDLVIRFANKDNTESLICMGCFLECRKLRNDYSCIPQIFAKSQIFDGGMVKEGKRSELIKALGVSLVLESYKEELTDKRVKDTISKKLKLSNKM